ncbi:unnamed protein product [Mytilus coruscus]|uniref:Hexosyltransferase n=1 Tax=Mytilus coruscus TaxID=42192 RepID=A0A6J8CS19_MYTCO|nr:unnamed protein product [Mytilus coruscus]
MIRTKKILHRQCWRNIFLIILVHVVFLCGICLFWWLYPRIYMHIAYMKMDFLMPNSKQIINDFRQTGNTKVKPFNSFVKEDAYKIDPSEHFCDNTACGSLQMLFVVKSHVMNFGHRYAIRKTWGGVKQLRTKIVFIIGYTEFATPFIEEELKQYNDIVQLNIIDTYENLVYKTIYSIFWLLDLNIETEFIHFVDDDRLVNTLNVYNIASTQIAPSDLVMIGHKLNYPRPQRDVTSKVYLSPAEYPFSYLPSHIIGGTVLTNMKTVKMLAIGVSYVKVIPIEDSYFGIVAAAFNIEMRHHSGFLRYEMRANVLPYILSSPGYENIYALIRDWKLIKRRGFTFRPAMYIYNSWSLLFDRYVFSLNR